MADRYDSLSPRDLIVTLRSLPRRFDQIHAGATGTEEQAARIDAPGPEGASLSGLVNDAARTMAVLGAAISGAVTSKTPVVTANALDGQERVEFDGPPMNVKNAIGLLSDDAPKLADQLDRLSADDWARAAAITGGGSITAVDLVRELVRSIIELLRSAEKQVAWIQAQ